VANWRQSDRANARRYDGDGNPMWSDGQNLRHPDRVSVKPFDGGRWSGGEEWWQPIVSQLRQ
jgi:hypothetical protein